MKTLTLTAAHSIGKLTVAVLLLTFGFGCAGDRGENPAPLELEDGKNVFEAADHSWTGISRVWYYRPSSEKALRVLMVIHGAGRNAEDYLDSWIEIAENQRLLVLAPEFSKKRAIRIGGAWEWRFNTGNVVSWYGQDVAQEKWYFESVVRAGHFPKMGSRARARHRSRPARYGVGFRTAPSREEIDPNAAAMRLPHRGIGSRHAGERRGQESATHSLRLCV
jgi:hypothetical protein